MIIEAFLYVVQFFVGALGSIIRGILPDGVYEEIVVRMLAAGEGALPVIDLVLSPLAKLVMLATVGIGFQVWAVLRVEHIVRRVLSLIGLNR